MAENFNSRISKKVTEKHNDEKMAENLYSKNADEIPAEYNVEQTDENFKDSVEVPEDPNVEETDENLNLKDSVEVPEDPNVEETDENLNLKDSVEVPEDSHVEETDENLNLKDSVEVLEGPNVEETDENLNLKDSVEVPEEPNVEETDESLNSKDSQEPNIGKVTESLDSKYSEKVPEEHNVEETDESLHSNSEGYPEGHLTTFKFTVCPYPIVKASEYQRIYQTHCKSLPTSWKFDVKLEEGSSNFCLVSLIRSDSIDKPVDAYVWLQGFDIFDQPVYYRIKFFKRGILPSVAQEERIQELAPEEYLATLPHKFMVVQLSALIVSCHRKILPSKEPEISPAALFSASGSSENLDSSWSYVPEGHYTTFKFFLYPYPYIKTPVYQNVYHTFCKLSPTSWKFDIKFYEEFPNSCIVRIVREDSICKPVCNAFVWVRCFDIHNRQLCFPRRIFIEGVLPFNVHVTSIRKLIPIQELRILAEKILVIEVSASIFACHQKIVPAKESEEVLSKEDPPEEDRSEEDLSEELRKGPIKRDQRKPNQKKSEVDP